MSPMHEDLIRPDLVGPALARALGDTRWERIQASLIAGGKSNLTFELTSDAGTLVLRRPPSGPLLLASSRSLCKPRAWPRLGAMIQYLSPPVSLARERVSVREL